MSGMKGLASLWRELERIQQEWLAGPGTQSRYSDHSGLTRRVSAHVMEGLIDPWRRVQRVRQALDLSGPVARRLIVQRLSGIDLSDIWTVLLEACKEIALYYGSSVVVGAVVGGVAGAFAGGVGAVPGAVGGAAVGSQVGGWILAWLGLKSLVEYLSDALPEALTHYENGFRQSWGSPPPSSRAPYAMDSPRAANVEAAASDFAFGHLIVITAMLSALVSYLTRGRGDKAKVLQEIRQSPRLGPKVADWVAANEGQLINHPALQHRTPKAQREGYAGGNAESPSRLAGGGRRGKGPDEEQPAVPKRMPEKKVPCFQPNDLPAAKIPEFDRQLAGQQRGLNNMTVDEYIKGRAAFDARQTVRDPAVAKEARRALQSQLQRSAERDLMNGGMLPGEARQQAARQAVDKMATLAALHNPDMVAAGKDVIDDFGDRRVNSRIGAQWRSRVSELDAAAQRVPKADHGGTKMNAKLERCK